MRHGYEHDFSRMERDYPELREPSPLLFGPGVLIPVAGTERDAAWARWPWVVTDADLSWWIWPEPLTRRSA